VNSVANKIGHLQNDTDLRRKSLMSDVRLFISRTAHYDHYTRILTKWWVPEGIISAAPGNSIRSCLKR
jgi:hypothetical protein